MMDRFLSSDMARGHVVALQRTDPRHLPGSGSGALSVASSAAAADSSRGGNVESAFGDLFLGALGEVNDLQLEAIDRQRQMVLAPDSVDIHDVTIAIAEANLAIAAAKQISDAAIRAYREIVNIR